VILRSPRENGCDKRASRTSCWIAYWRVLTLQNHSCFTSSIPPEASVDGDCLCPALRITTTRTSCGAIPPNSSVSRQNCSRYSGRREAGVVMTSIMEGVGPESRLVKTEEIPCRHR
jgi:hypothetical protein